MRLSSRTVLLGEKIEPMQFYELNSSRMDYRELSADDLDLLTPLLRSAETMQTLGGALSYEQTLDWLVDTLRRYQTEGCGWLLALDKPTGVPAALCGLTYEQVGAERVLTANCIVRHELRGIGVGRECIAACLLYAFESMHADEVSAFVQKDDLAGLHTAVACRMQPTEKGQSYRLRQDRTVCTVCSPESAPRREGRIRKRTVRK